MGSNFQSVNNKAMIRPKTVTMHDSNSLVSILENEGRAQAGTSSDHAYRCELDGIFWGLKILIEV